MAGIVYKKISDDTVLPLKESATFNDITFYSIESSENKTGIEHLIGGTFVQHNPQFNIRDASKLNAF